MAAIENITPPAYNHTGLQFGVALAAPITQTILPIIVEPHGMMHGFYFIPSTTFNGSETTFALATSTVPIKVVQRPRPNADGSNQFQNSVQFMAAVWDVNVERNRPWQGHSEWVNPNDTGMFSRWSMPEQIVRNIVNNGALFESFRVRMNIVAAQPAAPQPQPPTGSNASLTWTSVGTFDALSQDCAFFDVNWFDLFQTSYAQTYVLADGTSARVPISITPLTAPAEFKVMVVKSAGQQVIAQGGEVFNTLRFIRVKDLTIAPGGTTPYTFTFDVTDNFNQKVSVTLTLTVSRA